MSIEAAIGRIDQILTLQQQIRDPASLTATSSSASGGASLTPSSATGSSTDFASELAAAQGLTGSTATGDSTAGLTGGLTSGGLGSAAGLTGGTVGSAAGLTNGVLGSTGGVSGVSSTGLPSQVQAMLGQANALVGKPYVYGGGHSGWAPQTGYDCSGFVSAVLHAGGYLSSPADTVTLPSQPGIEAGPGQYVTIYDRSGAGEDGHVIIDLNGQFYESGGESGSWGGGGGVEKIGTPSAAYLATFNDVLHPAGL